MTGDEPEVILARLRISCAMFCLAMMLDFWMDKYEQAIGKEPES